MNLRPWMSYAIKAEAWPATAVSLPRIQAHRGFWKAKNVQENSLEAFHAAKNYNIAMCECDLRLSKDQIPVVFHDQNLSRLGNDPRQVSELTVKELKALANVPTLREILLDPFVPRRWNLELKSKAIIDDPLERKVAEEVKLHRAEGKVYFSSFNPFSLMRIGLHLPQVPRALLVTNQDDEENRWLLKNMVLAPLFSFHLVHLDRRILDEEGIEHWQKRGIPVAVWTVNGKSEIETYLKMGAVSVITDTPEVTINV